ncbi:hypothetical protein PENANT_c023G01731 [Penicillium antarcticum]|uniref:Copper-fist domain-containing protein n=1 Tax=Penicillium antarcticum TaxID=416450 RepID=A0A1V6PYT2_9EURO|nr:uncharacterized protein N7508_006214 [Penicillium antarcticum]KAJ5301351.1 hypothetical protein N7508_006214 [Penicillium antarcticum]OQD82113.1 hypothetical protein PENANT_c023G01731 [Penicillium antarcticum]
MPLDEEGAKWSCEPCIRGHRSSKCQHFDRLMMKVPKAGRPLAKCPHPKGTCSCQKTYAVMVRIPKGSSCLCRPLYKVPMEDNDSTQSPPTLASTSSPAPGKVQKSGRRQSTMQAAPENIARALENMPDNLKIEDGTPNLLRNLSQNGLDSYTPATQNHKALSPKEPSREASQPPPVSSCCSKKEQLPTQAPVVAAAQNGGSCCGSRPSTSEPQQSNAEKQQFQQPAAWDSQNQMYMPYGVPDMTSWGSQMSVHGNYIPATSTSSQAPIFQNGFSQNAMPPPNSQPSTSNGFSLNVGTQSSMGYNPVNGLGISQPSMSPYMSNHSHSPYPIQTVPSGDTCHECSCGEDCQCLGCASHPFNTTTRKHVQEMGAMITFNGDEKNPESINPYQSSPFQGATSPATFNYYMQGTPSLDQYQHNPFDGYSDPNSAMPSGYSSPLTGPSLNHQLMHPSEYYTLEYPVGLPSACSDVTGSCQCGSDCSCVGCLTHSGHNGFSLDTPIPPNPFPENAEQQQGPTHVPHTSSATATSRIPVLDNVSVPCLSPRALETSMI